MEYVTLNTGAKMPLEGFGVFQLPDGFYYVFGQRIFFRACVP